MSESLLAVLRRRFSQDSLFWLCAATVLLLIPVLLVLAYSTVTGEQRREDAQRTEVYQSYETRLQIQEVLSLMKDAETSQRGYVITGVPDFLDHNKAATANLDGELNKLERLLLGKPEQQLRLYELRRTIGAKFTEMNYVIRLRDEQGLSVAGARVAKGDGKRQMDHIRAVAGQMTAAEAVDLSRQLGEEQAQTHRARAFVTLAFGLVLLAIVVAGVMAFRYTALRSRLILRARAEASRRQAIFDSAMDAIITLNPSGGLESINKAGERMFGYPEAELIGHDISRLVPLAPGEAELFLDRLRNARSLRNGKTREFEGRRRDGSTFPVDVNIGEMPQPDGAHVVAVMRDCTDRKRAEQAKNEFVSTVSHELRTPLTSIAGSLGLLTGGAAGALPERATRLVTIAESNSRRLVRLINDILDIEKITSGTMSFSMKPLDLGQQVQRAVEGVSGVATELGVTIAYTAPADPVTVQADADRLTQVLTNLLSNAAKFSPPGGNVDVTITTVDSRAQVSVRDQGSGIPDDFRDRIFSKFAQADSSDTRQKGGTGLGLAITKEIVERHGGRIWFDSPPGEGATFHVELPMAQGSSNARQGSGPRLLLCEDDVLIARVLADALELQGFRVDSVHMLAEAEAALAGDHAFNALLLDLRLPDGNGLDLLRKLRTRPETQSLPVIIVSGDRQTPGEGSFDVVDWIEKPVDLRRLQGSLDIAFGAGQGPPLVLHVDDDPDLRRLVVEAFGDRGRVVAAESLTAAREVLATMTPQMVILDIGLPDGSGLELLPDLVDRNGQALPVVIFSAQSVETQDVADAVDAVLTKSRTSLEQLIQTVRRLSHNAKPRQDRRA